MNILENRIVLLRKTLGYSQEKFAQKLNLSRNFINQIEAGKKNPSDRTILDICREFNVNEEWLRNGTGNKEQSMSRNEEIQTFANQVMSDMDESIKKRLLIALSKLNEDDWKTIEKIVDELSKK